MISHKFAALYLCQDGLPIDKSPNMFMGYDKIESEYLNRDNRMIYTLCKPYGYFGAMKTLVSIGQVMQQIEHRLPLKD